MSSDIEKILKEKGTKIVNFAWNTAPGVEIPDIHPHYNVYTENIRGGVGDIESGKVYGDVIVKANWKKALSADLYYAIPFIQDHHDDIYHATTSKIRRVRLKVIRCYETIKD